MISKCMCNICAKPCLFGMITWYSRLLQRHNTMPIAICFDESETFLINLVNAILENCGDLTVVIYWSYKVSFEQWIDQNRCYISFDIQFLRDSFLIHGICIGSFYEHIIKILMKMKPNEKRFHFIKVRTAVWNLDSFLPLFFLFLFLTKAFSCFYHQYEIRRGKA